MIIIIEQILIFTDENYLPCTYFRPVQGLLSNPDYISFFCCCEQRATYFVGR